MLFKAKLYKALKKRSRYHEWLLLTRMFFKVLIGCHGKKTGELLDDLLMNFIDANLRLHHENEPKIIKKLKNELIETEFTRNGSAFERTFKSLNYLKDYPTTQLEFLHKLLESHNIPLKMVFKFIDFMMSKFEENPEEKKKLLSFKNSLMIREHIRINA